MIEWWWLIPAVAFGLLVGGVGAAVAFVYNSQGVLRSRHYIGPIG